MSLLIFMMIFFTIFIFIHIIFTYIHKEKLAVKNRLGSLARKSKTNHFDEELSKPLFNRLLKPVVDDISKVLLKVTPKELINNFEKKILMAGTPYNFTIREWTNIMVGIIIFLPLLTILIGFINSSEPLKVALLILFEVIVGILLPNLVLTKKMQDRKNNILKTLPDVIDLLTVSVEAGLAFDGALAKVVEKAPGETAREFNRVIHEMKIGKPKKDALKEMSNRVGLQDMNTFVSAIIQADQLGVSIGNVLRIQSEQMRQKRRQRAQEKAMKAPIKMLLPMVFFIFPTIFTVLIGPVIIKMIGVFMK